MLHPKNRDQAFLARRGLKMTPPSLVGVHESGRGIRNSLRAHEPGPQTPHLARLFTRLEDGLLLA